MGLKSRPAVKKAVRPGMGMPKAKPAVKKAVRPGMGIAASKPTRRPNRPRPLGAAKLVNRLRRRR
tara:strand:+ start:353 stop:547 length:195 start_codon:yes stop_codon:yes gene_type:complete